MLYKAGIYLVEKILDPSLSTSIAAEKETHTHHGKPLEDRLVKAKPKAVFVPGEKELSEEKPEEQQPEKGFTTLYDSQGQPIIKLKYSRDRITPSSNDGREQRIALFEIIKKGSLSFAEHEGEYFVQSNLELTNLGYHLVKDFLSGNPNVKLSKKSRSGDYVIKHTGYRGLLKRRRVLLLQKTIDSRQVEALEWICVSKGNKTSLRPRTTTQEFNTYVYELLLRTYKHFKKPFFRL